VGCRALADAVDLLAAVGVGVEATVGQ